MSKRLVVPMVLFACLAVPSASSAAPRDRDRDRLPDRWEKGNGLSTSRPSAKRDPDRDGLANRREYRLRTKPRVRDTDGDGVRDGAEVKRHHTDPRKADTDGDGFSDGAELLAGTDPRAAGRHPARPVGVFDPGAVASPLDDP